MAREAARVKARSKPAKNRMIQSHQRAGMVKGAVGRPISLRVKAQLPAPSVTAARTASKGQEK